LIVIKPDQTYDGKFGPAGGVVEDSVFGEAASLEAPPGYFSRNVDVGLSVLEEEIELPIPQGFSAIDSRFVNVQFNPEQPMPLPSPGLTLTIPLRQHRTPGTLLTLFRINPATGLFVPAQAGPLLLFAVGTVNSDGFTVTFKDVRTFSTLAALEPAAAIPGDVDGSGAVDCADIAIVRTALGSRLGQPRFNPAADVNGDSVVNVHDLAFVSRLLPTGAQCP
jgi:hypothetical protein